MQNINEKEALRLEALCALEKALWDQGISVAGMDEAGRGPLAGPVTAACVWMPAHPLLPYVNDSKRVSEARREKLFDDIRDVAEAYGIGWASVAEIDELNILQATKLACERAYEQMRSKPQMLFTDALSGLRIPVAQRAIIHGDAVSYSIAAASILAKVARDRAMRELDARFPQYGFAAHKGYGTARHIEAIRGYGPCEAHRRLFIRNFCERENA